MYREQHYHKPAAGRHSVKLTGDYETAINDKRIIVLCESLTRPYRVATSLSFSHEVGLFLDAARISPHQFPPHAISVHFVNASTFYSENRWYAT